jgi:3'-phosphoadenosine 5'-phosphosulfate sulfotransferase (PAPS reductase)/FAD synthetase
VPLTVVRREKGDLLQQVEERGMWPDNKNRYCTSDQKRDQVAKLHTVLANEYRAANANLDRPVRILNCMGFRIDESPARAKKLPFEVDKRQTNGRRAVWNWLPIHGWNVAKVWETIKASGVRYHYAYDKGMPRLSCCFCIFAPKDALVIAGRENPELLNKYVALEEKIGHTFQNGSKIADIKALIEQGYEPKNVQNWTM